MLEGLAGLVSISFWVIAPLTVLVTLVLGVVTRLPAVVLPGLIVAAVLTLLPDSFGSDDALAWIASMGFAAAATANLAQGVTSLVTGEHDPTRSTFVDGLDFRSSSRPAHTLGAMLAATLLGLVAGGMVALAGWPLWKWLGGPFTFAELAVLGFSVTVAVSILHRGAVVKGAAAGALGLVLGGIGIDPISGEAVFTLGQPSFWPGLPVAAVLLGILAVPDLLSLLFGHGRPPAAAMTSREVVEGFTISVRVGSWRLRDSRTPVFVRSFLLTGFIGLVVAGVFPLGRIQSALVENVSAWTPLTTFEGPFSKLLLLVVGVPLVALLTAGIVMAGSSHVHRLTVAPPRVVTATAVPLVLLLTSLMFPAQGFILPAIVTGAALLGWLMRSFGWPRVPLIIGLILSPRIGANGASALIGPDGAQSLFNSVRMVSVLLAVVLFIAYRRYLQPMSPIDPASGDVQSAGRSALPASPALPALVIGAIAAWFFVESFTYVGQIALMARYSAVAVLLFVGVQLVNDWRAGLIGIRVDVASTLPRSHAFWALAIVSAASWIAFWPGDMRWSALIFAGLLPLLLGHSVKSRIVSALVPLWIVYAYIYWLDKNFHPIWS